MVGSAFGAVVVVAAAAAVLGLLLSAEAAEYIEIPLWVISRG